MIRTWYAANGSFDGDLSCQRCGAPAVHALLVVADQDAPFACAAHLRDGKAVAPWGESRPVALYCGEHATPEARTGVSWWLSEQGAARLLVTA